MKKPIWVGREEYHAGSRGLMGELLQPVTRWVGSVDEIQFAINQLCSYRTKYVVLRRQKKVVAKHIEQKRLVQKDIFLWEFALFRGKIVGPPADEANHPPSPPKIPIYSAYNLQAMTSDKFGAVITKIMRGEAKYRMPKGSSGGKRLYQRAIEELETLKVLDKDKKLT